MPKISSQIESLLFIHGEPLSISKLAKIIGQSEDKIKDGLNELKQDLSARESGLTVVSKGDEAELATDPSLAKLIAKLIKDDFDSNLTPAALETLTIISYLGPVSRAEVDFIRGVNSSFTLRALLLRGLVDRRPDPKRPYLFIYEPSFDLLKYFGLKQIEDLPDYQKYHHLLKSYQEKENKNVAGNPNAVV